MTLASFCSKRRPLRFFPVYLLAISLFQCADSPSLCCSSCAGPHGLSTVCHCVTFYLSHIWHSLGLLCLLTRSSLFNVEDFFSVKNTSSFLCSNCVGDVLVLEARLCVRELSAESHTMQICYETELPSVGEKTVSVFTASRLSRSRSQTSYLFSSRGNCDIAWHCEVFCQVFTGAFLHLSVFLVVSFSAMIIVVKY